MKTTPSSPTPHSPAMVRVFRAVSRRPFTGLASLAASVWWFAYVASILAKDHISDGLLGLGWFVWFFAAPFGLASAARRLDEALARRRGDDRHARLTTATSTLAFLGLFVGLFASIGLAVLLPFRDRARLLDVLLWVAPPVFAWLCASASAVGTRAASATVSYDALQVTGRGATTVPLRDIAELTTRFHLVRVRLRDGSVLSLDAGALGVSAVELHGAISTAWHQANEKLRGAAALHRNDLPIAQWREAIRARATGATDLRAQALDRDDLVAALEHPAATIEERVGAALALHGLDEDGSARVRVAADAALTTELREVLGAVADGHIDDEALCRVATARR